jgi:hypothetical protein
MDRSYTVKKNSSLKEDNDMMMMMMMIRGVVSPIRRLVDQ